MVKKKAYMKTMEALLAIIITAIFMILLIPQFRVSEVKEDKPEVLEQLEKDPDFRISVVTTAEGCYNKSSNNALTQKIESYLLDDYEYRICLNKKALNLTEKKVYADSVFILGNMTNFSHREVRLYYWLP